ncbi:MAG: hypothetical protein CSA50_04980 [Gammaproteobacteria bacterium]|nr:MAG: hypothetical protein CSA50_04980 [Gammaproteobacteria bacterium]
MKKAPVYAHVNNDPYHLHYGYDQSGTGYYPLYPSRSQKVLSAVKTGAMIGATGAVAMSLYEVSQGRFDKRQALKSVAKASATLGVAAGAAKAAGLVFEDKPALSLLASFAAGTTVSYVLGGLPGNIKAQGDTDD